MMPILGRKSKHTPCKTHKDRVICEFLQADHNTDTTHQQHSSEQDEPVRPHQVLLCYGTQQNNGKWWLKLIFNRSSPKVCMLPPPQNRRWIPSHVFPSLTSRLHWQPAEWRPVNGLVDHFNSRDSSKFVFTSKIVRSSLRDSSPLKTDFNLSIAEYH